MGKPKNYFKASFHAESGRMIFDDSKNKDKLRLFLEYYENQSGEIKIEFFSEVSHHRHRYYRGLLLPVVSDAMGYKDANYVHQLILKPRFLMEKVSCFEEIPERVQNRARYVFDNAFDEETGELLYISGTNEIQQRLVAYIPSMGDVTDERAKQFIKDVEDFFYNEMDGGFDPSLNESMIALRSKCQL